MKVVEVVRIEDGEVVDRIECANADPERVERGLLINMDRDEYFTRIVDEGEGNAAETLDG